MFSTYHVGPYKSMVTMMLAMMMTMFMCMLMMIIINAVGIKAS